MNYQFHCSLTWPNSERLWERYFCWQISTKKEPCPNLSETLLIYKIWLHIMLAPWQLKVSVHGSGSTQPLKEEWQTEYIHIEYRMYLVGINVHCQNKSGNKSFESNIRRNSFRPGLPFTYNIFTRDSYSRNSSALSLSFITTHKVSSNKLGLGDYEEFHLLKYNAT
jgi:hypothetical protein